MFVEACSLGCGNGVSGSQITCSIVNVGQNAEITLLFSEEIDLSTVTSGTFQVINTSNGTVPVGTYMIDPSNSKRLIFRPGLDFDSLGNPEYAFDENETYRITIPGANQGDSGPFISSANGKINQARLECSIRTSEGLIDPVPGPPSASVFVTKDDGLGGGVEVPANGATQVLSSSKVKVIFADIMNPATIANLSTGQSNSILVKIDSDGDLSTTGDQVTWSGTWTVDVDFDLLRTVAEFTPSGGFPTAGGDPLNPRLTIVTLPSQLLDLKGNSLENPGSHVFATQIMAFPEIRLPKEGGEDFVDSSNEDKTGSGADWGAGRLTWGVGGGAGRHGALIVRSGETLTLNTDSQVFPLVNQAYSILSNDMPGTDYDPLVSSSWPTITVTDGVFEFSSVTIEPNATLILEGSQPGRIYSRGELIHNGVIDLSGETPEPHVSNDGGFFNNNPSLNIASATRFGGPGGLGGPGAGAGGQGADRWNLRPFRNAANNNWINGAFFPGTGGATIFPDGETAVSDGRPGEGVGGSTSTGGIGGVHYPPSLPTNWVRNSANFGDLEFSVLPPAPTGQAYTCGVAMAAGPGSGGAYALPGGVGTPASPFTPISPNLLPNTPADTPGGDNSSLGLEPPGDESGSPLLLIRHLLFRVGNLRGGAGGGGGGTSIYGTKSNSATSADGCSLGTAGILPFFDHSAAGGGGGGGALQLTAGRRISMGGSIDCSGGDGGSATASNAPLDVNCTDPNASTGTPNCSQFAAPGGGGSGGAIKLQSVSITLGGQANQINVSGGLGGFGAGGSVGGAGSPGLVRIERSGFVDQATDAALFSPFVAPTSTEASYNTPYTSAAILSLGEWGGGGMLQFRPESFSGAQSCWMKPEGTFFQLAFSTDDTVDVDDPDKKSWNMDIIYTVPGGTKKFPYRGLSSDPDFPNMGGDDFETFLGSTLNHDEASPNGGSFLVVRFQGARATGQLADPCNVDLVLGTEVEGGSLTPWVRSPEELNQFSPLPNMVRFVVIFEPRLAIQGGIQSSIVGVTNLEIRVQPD